MELSARQFFNRLKLGDLFYRNFLAAVRSGENKASGHVMTEVMVAEEDWIKEVETYVFHLEQVVKNPKKSIIDDKEIVNVEKAKRITSESIRHLASHSDLVQSVEADGEVKPKKILNIFMEEDTFIYENRFIYTLLMRLDAFLEQKYNHLKRYIGAFDTNNLAFSSKFEFGDATIAYDMNVSIRAKSATDFAQIDDVRNANLVERLETIKRRVSIMIGSNFFKLMKKSKPLQPPISKTNILRMNKDYSACYKLWLFMFSMINTGYVVKVSEQELPIDGDYYDDLTYLIGIGMKAVMTNSYDAETAFSRHKDPIEESPQMLQVLPKPDYKPSFEFDFSDDGGFINAYYYDEIRKQLIGEDGNGLDGDGADGAGHADGALGRMEKSVDIAFSFTSFFRRIMSMNNTLFQEMLQKNLAETETNTALETLQAEFNRKKEMYRRHHLLTRLKEIDFEESRRVDAALLGDIKKAQNAIDKLILEERSRLTAGKDGAPRISIDVRKPRSTLKKGAPRSKVVAEKKRHDDALAKATMAERLAKQKD